MFIVLYCVTLHILVLGVECVLRSTMMCLWKKQTVQCGTVSAVLCDSVYIGIGCCMCYGQKCCVYGRNRQTVQCGMVIVL